MTRQILRDEKAPFLLTFLFAILGWVVVHIVDRSAKSPILKYTVYDHKDDERATIKYTIHNITDDKVFENVDFFVKTTTPDTIIQSGINFFPPMKINSDTDIFERNANYVKFHVSVIQPKSTFEIQILKNGTEVPGLRFFSNSPIYLSENNIETFFIENETFLLLSLSVVCCIAVIIYLYKLK